MSEKEIENVDSKYKAELNFVEMMNLSRNGMIKEIEQEFNVIQLCLIETKGLDKQYQSMIDRIIVMPLRKLLCENQSVLLKVCPDFRMPALKGIEIALGEEQRLIHPPFITEQIEKWVSLDDWLEQKISWFIRDENEIAEMVPQYVYEAIVKRLNSKAYKHLKQEFLSLFVSKQVEYHGETMEVYCHKNPEDRQKNKRIYQILDEIGYNSLSLYEYIKHISDKRGAHVDTGHSLVVELVNYADKNGITPIHYFAIQMIYAAKKQIPELELYWKEMPELVSK